MKDHSHLVRHPSSIVSQNRSGSDFNGRRMRTINHGNELWIGNSPQIYNASVNHFPGLYVFKTVGTQKSVTTASKRLIGVNASD